MITMVFQQYWFYMTEWFQQLYTYALVFTNSDFNKFPTQKISIYCDRTKILLYFEHTGAI